MIIKYQLTFEDDMALQKNFIKNADCHKRREKLSFILAELTVFFAGMVLIAIFLPQDINLALFCGISIGAGILTALLLAPFIKKIYTPVTLWQYRILLKKRKDINWPRNVTLNLNEKGIEICSAHNKVKGNVQVAWESIKKVNEDENHFFLYFEESEAFIIPKSNYILSEAEQGMLRSRLKNQLNR